MFIRLGSACYCALPFLAGAVSLGEKASLRAKSAGMTRYLWIDSVSASGDDENDKALCIRCVDASQGKSLSRGTGRDGVGGKLLRRNVKIVNDSTSSMSTVKRSSAMIGMQVVVTCTP